MRRNLTMLHFACLHWFFKIPLSYHNACTCKKMKSIVDQRQKINNLQIKYIDNNSLCNYKARNL